MSNDSPVRVRLAPSPTGEVHIGTIWTALFDWIFVQQRGGSFILRIEDTDQKRLVPGSIERIYESLTWYGLEPTEGPQQGGPYGPYIQSQRLALYRPYAEQLVSQQRAYYCFCTPERLEDLRRRQARAKQAPKYDKHCLRLAVDEVKSRLANGERHVIRLNVPPTGSIELRDLIRGTITLPFAMVDDQVLMKSDCYPTYHLAVVVDDHLMKITHVIRGEEWISSLPKHLLLYQAFGWSAPQFAHLPLILGRDKRKLSKRAGALSALAFRDRGYLPEAMMNFLALMGWHPKGKSEILSREQLIEQFRFEDVNPSGAVFDQTKLDWLNGAYIRALDRVELLRRIEPFWHIPKHEQVDRSWKMQALDLVRERLRRLSEIDGYINFAFPSVWDGEQKKLNRALVVWTQSTTEQAQQNLLWVLNWVPQYSGRWEAETLRDSMIESIAQAGKTNVEVLWPLRVALTLRAASPDVFDVAALLGREETLRRVKMFVS